MSLAFKTPEELEELLGQRLKRLRVDCGLTQEDVADRSGASLRAIQQLEAGMGSRIQTLLRFLKAIGRADAIDILAPEPSISPMAMLASHKLPTRVRRSKKKAD